MLIKREESYEGQTKTKNFSLFVHYHKLGKLGSLKSKPTEAYNLGKKTSSNKQNT